MFAYCIILHNRDMREQQPLPEGFCWTRFGTEAGQSMGAIVDRKEKERQANGGLFLWGIGNAVGSAITELAREYPEPEVLFSPIKGKPRECDARPKSIVMWTHGETIDQRPYQLPQHSVVTSRFEESSPKSSHYALVCFSMQPIELSQSGPTLAFNGLRNLVSGKHLGASQVTAVVTVAHDATGGEVKYPIAFRARLVAPYFIRLHHPIPVAIVTDGTHVVAS
jgi:hypothetical protein